MMEKIEREISLTAREIRNMPLWVLFLLSCLAVAIVVTIVFGVRA